MLLNKSTLHSGTGTFLIKLIRDLLSIVPAEDYYSSNFRGIRSQVEYIESIYNEKIVKNKNI
ncbi:MAG: hypothetical protein CMM25_05555 [Rhodospirillaceae bacterium]|nr:hypothetical protein [Rhodospirillaceae bacterium]